MVYQALLLTGEQIRAARALARLEQQDLARLAGLSLETIKRLERSRGPVDATLRTIGALVRALDEIGVTFERFPDGTVGVRERAQANPATTPTPALQSADHSARIHRLIHYSTARTPEPGAMRPTLDSISEVSRRRNASLGVTGALLAWQGRYLHILEGERDAVRHVYGLLALDARHHGLTILEERAVHSRQFRDWTLCCGLFPDDDDLIRGEPSLREGLRLEALTPASALGLLATMRDLQRVEPRCRRGLPSECGLQLECEDRACAV